MKVIQQNKGQGQFQKIMAKSNSRKQVNEGISELISSNKQDQSAKQIFKIQTMSTNEYFRLALLQYIRMQHNLEALQKSQAEVDSLRATVSARHKKHRRSDKEIQKNLNCAHCQRIYASEVALRLHLKLKHRETLMDKNSDSHTVIVSESDKENGDMNIEVV